MTQNTVQEPPIVTITESVADRLREAAKSANVPDVIVRFSLQEEPTGLAHKIALEVTPAAEDVVFEQHGITIVVEPQQVPQLNGAHFDFEVIDGQSRLTVVNPNLTGQ
ncbi:MAG: HesB/IscA family protein [Tepidiformaceae bacterium]